jgi:hypothetical protein
MWNSEEGWGNRFSTRLEPGSITDRQQFIKTLSLAAEQSTAQGPKPFLRSQHTGIRSRPKINMKVQTQETLHALFVLYVKGSINSNDVTYLSH